MEKPKPKIYLETTLFNYYFDTDREFHPHTVHLFEEIATGKYDAFTSDEATRELKNAPVEKKEKMLALLSEYPITTLPVNDMVNILADIYVAEKIIPAKYRTDGVHIAVAAVNGLDCVVSMNFQHIVKHTVEQLANAVNLVKGYRPIELKSPMEFFTNEDTQHH